jgi:hypothetical protein
MMRRDDRGTLQCRLERMVLCQIIRGDHGTSAAPAPYRAGLEPGLAR